MLNGHGIEPNIDEAIHWFNKAANLGEPKAIYHLGKMYEQGLGSKINNQRAMEMYKKAS